ncbi:MAG: pantetheine-phosphate adenylyltransferase [Candidatus Gastranaerophilaceae bacterium]
MTTAIYPGSFDPITNGHLDVLKTSSEIFEKVIIAVAYNSQKKNSGLLTVDERVELIKESIKDFKNVEVDCFEGLTVEYAKKKNAKVLIRGLRAVSDFEFEMQLSQTNSALDKDIKTIFLTTRPKYNFISSSSVKEVVNFGGNVSKFVPTPVNEYLKNKFQLV